MKGKYQKDAKLATFDPTFDPKFATFRWANPPPDFSEGKTYIYKRRPKVKRFMGADENFKK